MLNAINQKLGMGTRLALIGGLCAVPIAMLGGLFVTQSWKDIAFAQKESAGTDYISAAFPLFEGAAAADQAAFDAMRGEYDAVFGSAEEAAALNASVGAQPRRDAARALFVAVADGSNLTLDPDLDSYYVMDMVVQRLPALHDAVAQVAEAAALGGEARLVAMAVANDHLNVAAAMLKSSANAAMAGAADGETRAALAAELAETLDAVEAFSLRARAAGEFASLDEGAFDLAADGLWAASTAELKRLLEARIARLQWNLAFWLGASALVLAMAGLLMLSISRGISSRITNIVQAMDDLAAEKVDTAIPCLEDQNETGRIAQALVEFKSSLIERKRLRAEAESMHERTAEQLREMEEAHETATREQAFVVGQIKDGLAKLYEGDLTYRLDEMFPDKYRAIRMDFNQTAQRLEEVMRSIHAASGSMRGTANEISAAADDLSRRTEQQAAGLEETAAALDEITATVRRSADNAKRTRDVASAAREEAEGSGEVLRETVEAMSRIEKSSDEIAQILSVMDEIAFQTNLLALNAGVEAARAGEAGKGFAVVATEVRALAQRSSDAAKDIKALINTSAANVDTGVSLVGRTASALERIAARVTEINGLVAEIAVSSDEQARGVAEVNGAVNQMDQITQQNAAMVEESTAASHSLAGEANALAEMVGQFKVERAPVEAAALRRRRA